VNKILFKVFGAMSKDSGVFRGRRCDALGLTVNFCIIFALFASFVLRLNRKIRVKMHPNLSFFSGEAQPLHHTPHLSTPTAPCFSLLKS